LVKQYGKRKAFFKGGNLTCRFHIRQHYTLYKEKCEAGDLPVNHWAIPRDIWKAMKEDEERVQKTKNEVQQTLNFTAVTGPCEFTRAATLHAVSKLIATDNQVSHWSVLSSKI